MNCEAGSLYPYRALLEEARITTCFNDYHDLMVAVRIGKEGYIRQIVYPLHWLN
jgi:phenolic acid decarboxylase